MSRTRILFHVALMLSLVFLLAAPALAQYGASLQGTVTDKSGAVVAGATVTANDKATGISHTATTSASGFYRISELPPGTYTVTVGASGFKKSSAASVVIEAELLRGLDVTLEIGQAQETVNVTEIMPALKTEDASISGTLTSTEVETLPAINRDPYELLRLARTRTRCSVRLQPGCRVVYSNSKRVSASDFKSHLARLVRGAPYLGPGQDIDD